MMSGENTAPIGAAKYEQHSNGSNSREAAYPARFLLDCRLCGGDWCDDRGKISKKFSGKLFRRRVDKATAELGDLTANLRIDCIIQHGDAFTLRLQSDTRAAFGKAGDAARALSRNMIPVWRIEIG